MATNNKSDETFSILTNYSYKQHISDYSVEAVAHNRLIEFNKGRNLVEKKKNALSWIRKLQEETEEALSNIHDLRLSDRRNVKEEIEQEKLSILDRIQWNYKGNFHYSDKYSSSYPELSYTISTRRMSGRYWYEASYGIVRNVNEHDVKYGSYNLFLTLDEAIDYIVEELKNSGQEALVKHYLKDHLRREIEKKNNDVKPKDYPEIIKQKNKERKEKKAQYIASRGKTRLDPIDVQINRIIDDDNIANSIYAIKRSSDIFTLNDFTRNLLVPYAYKQLSDARDHQRDVERAAELNDNSKLNLDTETNEDYTIDEHDDNEQLVDEILGTYNSPNNRNKESVNIPTSGIDTNSLPVTRNLSEETGAVFVLDDEDYDKDKSKKISLPTPESLNSKSTISTPQETVTHETIDEPSSDISENVETVENINDDTDINVAENTEYNENIVDNTPSDINEQVETVENIEDDDSNIDEYTEVNENLKVNNSNIDEFTEINENISLEDPIIDNHSEYSEEIDNFEELISENDGVMITDNEVRDKLRKALPDLFDSSRLPTKNDQKENDMDNALDDFFRDM